MSGWDAILDNARRRDAADPLRHLRDRFELPEGVVYLDGNSLGPLPTAARAVVADAAGRQWGEGLIRSWTAEDWIDAPRRVGAKIAPLLGADADEVVVADSVSVNLFKMLTALVRLNPQRWRIVTEAGNFPTDLHVAAGVAESLGLELVSVPRGEVLGRLDDRVSSLLLTHVHYRTGERFDMRAVNAAAAAAGVPVLWDLSHSVGAVPLDLPGEGAEYAVGCGYKYLNGGPGAPAFLYASRHRRDALRPALQGWMGDADPFAFRDGYTPAAGMDRFRVGTPPVLSLLALEAGVETFGGVAMTDVWAKSSALFDWFAGLMTDHCPDFRLLTPREPSARGSHISFAHPNAWPVNNALIERGVIGDFRRPDVLRLGLTPLYTRFADVAAAVRHLAEIVETGAWRAERFNRASRVT